MTEFQEHRPVSSRVIARWFVNHADRSAGEAITHLKLQKLVYYAEAWFLANFDRPLTTNEYEAWAHGPVVRDIYSKYRKHSWDALPPERGQRPNAELEDFLEAVYEEYGQFSAKKLEKMTHEEDPWREARNGLPPEAASTQAIPKLNIRNFYAGRLGKEQIAQLSH